MNNENLIEPIENEIKQPSRREVLRMGLMGGAIGAASLAIGNVSSVFGKEGTTPAMVANDVEIVNGAIQLEQKAVNTYKAAYDAGLLKTKAFADVALQFASDHTAHRDKLMGAVKNSFKKKPAVIEGLGTFPIPPNVLKGKEEDVIRYALTLEMIASKTYLDNVNNKLKSDEAKDLATTILAVETQHAAIFRAVLMVVLKTKGLDGDDKLVPYPFLDQQPTPPLPKA